MRLRMGPEPDDLWMKAPTQHVHRSSGPSSGVMKLICQSTECLGVMGEAQSKVRKIIEGTCELTTSGLLTPMPPTQKKGMDGKPRVQHSTAGTISDGLDIDEYTRQDANGMGFPLTSQVTRYGTHRSRIQGINQATEHVLTPSPSSLLPLAVRITAKKKRRPSTSILKTSSLASG